MIRCRHQNRNRNQEFDEARLDDNHSKNRQDQRQRMPDSEDRDQQQNAFPILERIWNGERDQKKDMVVGRDIEHVPKSGFKV